MSSNALSTEALPEPDIPVMTTSSVALAGFRARRFPVLRRLWDAMPPCYPTRPSFTPAQTKWPRASASPPDPEWAAISLLSARRRYPGLRPGAGDGIDAVAHLRHDHEHHDERSRREHEVADQERQEQSFRHLLARHFMPRD